jgi:hypothetical protein
MADVKRSDKSVGPAPAINYDYENPPNELKQDFKINSKEGNLGYLSVGKHYFDYANLLRIIF